LSIGVPASDSRRALTWRLTMKASRILSAILVLFAIAFGSLATGACTTADNAASGTSGNSSGGGY
jgi:hypothetical protein